MSNKKYEHWCDLYHPSEEEKEKRVSELEKQSEQFYKDVEKWLLEDISKYIKECMEDESPIKKNHIARKCYRILDNAEELVSTIKDANGVYAIYGVDWEYRRKRWLKARGLCFKLNSQLQQVASTVVAKTNIEKYTRLAGITYKLANMIKNNMASDDIKKKEHCREYLPSEIKH